ncbi:hypothetical protein LEP1GSC036_3687 [Leptospira weilii str. 2006001853]|uniref:Lipoprotein n=2 Tax=Leptospira weilii TaxID=28184 RepID=A0A828Z1N8_9LEPT|nr:hypothetical protein [Leptospira weilii]EKR64162.1 hypothetical protein LEP1GSC036_3687 [Leptospira weilii str. 2006001853]EMN45581.1 hypothetical protein LEP1GSC086_2429 [Leptospira weilii str. LNT 1234]
MKSYENKGNKIRFFIYVSICFFLFDCVQKKPQQAAFWKEYLFYQKNIFREYPTGGIRNALFGNLTSEDVYLLQEKDDMLSIDFYLQKTDQGFRNVITTEKIPENVPYQIHVEYFPTFFKDQKTFRMKREMVSILPTYGHLDFFHHVDRLQNFLRSGSNHSSKLALISNTHRYLCYVCHCDSGRVRNASWLLYELNESTKIAYPQFYKRFNKLLNQVSYRITIFKSGEFLNGIELYNEGTKTFLKIPDTSEGYWSKPEVLHIRVSLFIRVYGLEIDIKNLGYKLHFYSSKNYGKITGGFSKLPEKKISGRFLKIFPPGMVNWFIPGNMDEYFDRYFLLLVNGSKGNEGNKFESEFFQNGNKMKVIFKSQAEIFQDRFTPFRSSNEKDDEPSFWDILQKNLIQDLS